MQPPAITRDNENIFHPKLCNWSAGQFIAEGMVRVRLRARTASTIGALGLRWWRLGGRYTAERLGEIERRDVLTRNGNYARGPTFSDCDRRTRSHTSATRNRRRFAWLWLLVFLNWQLVPCAVVTRHRNGPALLRMIVARCVNAADRQVQRAEAGHDSYNTAHRQSIQR